MKSARFLVVLGLIALFAFATMAPHFRTWDVVRASVSTVDTEIVALNFTPGGNTFHGDAEITLKGPVADGRTLTVVGLLKFQARCISPLCGGFDVGPVEMHGETKFNGEFDGNAVEGQGTLSGQVLISKDERTGTYSFTNFNPDGMPLRARVSSVLTR